MRESDIVYEGRSAWVCRGRSAYTVFRTGPTHSTSDSSYPLNADGLSIAVARARYLDGRQIDKADAGHPDNVIL